MKRWPQHIAYFWETAPFFRVLLPFAAGILVYDRLRLPIISVTTAMIIVSVAFAVFSALAYQKRSNTGIRIATFVLLNLVIFVSGLLVCYFGDVRNDQGWFGNKLHAGKYYLAYLSGEPIEKENSWKLRVSVIGGATHGQAAAESGDAFLYASKMQSMQLHSGDTVVIPGKWQQVRNAGNPFEFDYAKYCRRSNILYQQFCLPGSIRLYGKHDPSQTSFIDRAHDWTMARLDSNISDHKTKGLIQAMLLGDEVNLDPDLLQSYSETGIVHIIAISGGNVAIFFIVISAILWWMKDKKHQWIKFAVALPLVWVYVLMAGAPPSAVRAALMFSLLAFAVILQKNNNSLNQLFTTAFLLLCAQPMWLFSAGFQLSFVAVLSLILFYTPVYKLWSPVNKIARLLWGTVAASVAAELLVAPVVVYYFHTFPLLFIVANVLAYLFMSVVLVLGIVVIAVSFVPVVSKFLGLCIVWLVTSFDRIVVWLQNLNPVSFHFITLKSYELLCLYFVVGGIALFLLKKQKTALLIGTGSLCVFMLSLCINEWSRLHQRRFIAFNTAHENHMELLQGQRYSVIGSDTAVDKKAAYAAKPAHIGWQAWEHTGNTEQEIFDLNGKTLLILNNDYSYSKDTFPADYVVINYHGAVEPAALKRIFSPSVVVIGNTCFQKKQEEFVTDCRECGLAASALTLNGGFVVE